MILLGSASKGDSQLTLEIPKGTYSGMVVELSGTNDTGQTIAVSEIGNIRLSQRGSDIVNIDLQDLSNINNAESGFNAFASATAGAVNAQFRINFGCYGDFNVKKFENSEGVMQIQFNSTGMAKLVSGTFSVYGIRSKGVEKYTRKLINFSQQIGTTGSVNVYQSNEPNINTVYFRTGSYFSNILMSKDNFVILNASGIALRQETGYNYRLESLPSFIMFPLNPSLGLAEIVSNQTKFNLTSASGSPVTVSIVLESLVFNLSYTDRSLKSLDVFNTQKLPSNPAVLNVAKAISKNDLSGTLSAVSTE